MANAHARALATRGLQLLPRVAGHGVPDVVGPVLELEDQLLHVAHAHLGRGATARAHRRRPSGAGNGAHDVSHAAWAPQAMRQRRPQHDAMGAVVGASRGSGAVLSRRRPWRPRVAARRAPWDRWAAETHVAGGRPSSRPPCAPRTTSCRTRTAGADASEPRWGRLWIGDDMAEQRAGAMRARAARRTGA